MLRVGILGAGWIGQHHAERWNHLPVTLAGFYDVTRAKASEAVSRFGGIVFESPDHLTQQVDIVQICTPTPFHKPQILAALHAGKFVFTEKPLARTVADAQFLVDECARLGGRLFVGQVLRFFPQYARARDLVQSGDLGAPLLIRMHRGAGHPFVSADRSWFTHLEQSGGAILEGGVHDFDFARWCFGEVETVHARGITLRQDLDLLGDHVVATLHFTSSLRGHVEESWMVTDGRFRQQLEIVGERGMMQYDSTPSEPFSVGLRRDGQKALLPGDALAFHDDPYFRQLEHFLDCVTHDREFLIAPADALEAVRISNACLESLRTGSPVTVSAIQ